MEKANSKAYVELFHLLFLEYLGQKLDKRLYALKGGCNLRFFLGSIRYSEDIDLDAHTIAVHTLKNLMDRLLSSTPFNQALGVHGITIVHYSSPKQTETTQRWKIQISTPEQSLALHTKIEFSRRNAYKKEELTIDPINRNLAIHYRLRPILVPHYNAQHAALQKIHALILRNQTQARDVFDLYHLLHSQKIHLKDHFSKKEKETAISCAFALSFADFKSQVVSYLETEYQTQYDDSALWEQMILSISEALA